MSEKIKLDNCNISYIQSKEDGIPVIFVHENSLSSITFRDILKTDLGKKYRLIAFDLPGHGDSSYSDNPIEDYSMPGLVNILKKVASHLYAENAVLVGHGLGGHIILESLHEMPWVRGICLFGAPPLCTFQQLYQAYRAKGGFNILFKGQLTEKELDNLAKAYTVEEYEYGVKEIIKKADYRFRKYFGNWIKTGEFINHKELLRHYNVPVAILHGEYDKLVNVDYLMNLKIDNLWGNEIKIILNTTHCPQIENKKRFTYMLEDFLDFVSGAKDVNPV